MFAGIIAGCLLRKAKFTEYVDKSVSWTILALLFFLGLSVGSNDTVMGNLRQSGLQALLLAFAGTAGSVLAAWAVYRFFFKKKTGA